MVVRLCLNILQYKLGEPRLSHCYISTLSVIVAYSMSTLLQ